MTNKLNNTHFQRFRLMIDRSPIGGASGLLCFVLAGLLAIACANRGSGPQGGPKDEKPPVLLKSTPENGTVNYQKNRIEILFDEIVLIENSFENVVVSPPQIKPAAVKAFGKKVVIELNDSIIPQTTYTIDFGDAIVDNNEKNKLAGFSYSFASGPVIDTLEISGILIDAETLNPLSKITIGIHSDISDTAFLTKPFVRITKTDAKGKFTVRNIRPGTYRIFALDDLGSNYRFDQPNELIAFLDTTFIPTVSTEAHIDTLLHDSIVMVDNRPDTLHIIDSIYSHSISTYLPKDILLKGFTERQFKQYLLRSERREPHRFSLYFNEKVDTLPRITALNFPFDNAVLLQKSANGDTLHYWLTDTLAWAVDTLRLSVDYYRTDSTNALSRQTDTLQLMQRGARRTAQQNRTSRGNREREKPKIEFLKLGTNLSSEFDVYRPIEVKFETPTKLTNRDGIHLEQKVDTVWRPLKASIEAADSIGLLYHIDFKWKSGESYRLRVDSAAFHELYGRHNDKYASQFTIKAMEKYSALIFELVNYTGKEIVQVLDKDDKVVRSQRATDVLVKFSYLEPGDYYARLFVDENDNGTWDPGDYKANRQAEAVYYYPSKLKLLASWDVEEYWDYHEVPLLEQKPTELIKEKKEDKR